MKVSAVCLGQPEKLLGKSYKSGINKQPVGYPVHVDENGLVGDSICNGKYHGGHEQAVYLEGSETLRWWAQELQRDLPPGFLARIWSLMDLRIAMSVWATGFTWREASFWKPHRRVFPATPSRRI